jgi:DeoR family fructose operon transcriptional repressor
MHSDDDMQPTPTKNGNPRGGHTRREGGAPMAMYAEERQQDILRRARADGRVEVAGLADLLDVTQETIRRDLDRLERQGLLRRVHGGAIVVQRLDVEPALGQRDTTAAAQKAAIAEAALAYLPSRGSVLIDAGSTTARLAAVLPPSRDLTVVTNGLPIAQLLASRADLTVQVVGGRVRGTTLAAVDAWAVTLLERLNVDVAFVGANGFSVARGLSTPDLAESAVKAAMVRAGRRVVVLADASKFGVDHLSSFARLADVDVLVTDTGLSAQDAALLRSEGPEVVRA